VQGKLPATLQVHEQQHSVTPSNERVECIDILDPEIWSMPAYADRYSIEVWGRGDLNLKGKGKGGKDTDANGNDSSSSPPPPSPPHSHTYHWPNLSEAVEVESVKMEEQRAALLRLKELRREKRNAKRHAKRVAKKKAVMSIEAVDHMVCDPCCGSGQEQDQGQSQDPPLTLLHASSEMEGSPERSVPTVLSPGSITSVEHDAVHHSISKLKLDIDMPDQILPPVEEGVDRVVGGGTEGGTVGGTADIDGIRVGVDGVVGGGGGRPGRQRRRRVNGKGQSRKPSASNSSKSPV